MGQRVTYNPWEQTSCLQNKSTSFMLCFSCSLSMASFKPSYSSSHTPTSRRRTSRRSPSSRWEPGAAFSPCLPPLIVRWLHRLLPLPPYRSFTTTWTALWGARLLRDRRFTSVGGNNHITSPQRPLTNHISAKNERVLPEMRWNTIQVIGIINRWLLHQ